MLIYNRYKQIFSHFDSLIEPFGQNERYKRVSWITYFEITMDENKTRRLKFVDEPNWIYFFLAWSAISILGFILSTRSFFNTRMLDLFVDLSGNNSVYFYYFFGLIFSGIRYGLIFGILQSIVLSFYVNKSILWFYATFAGYVLKELASFLIILMPEWINGNGVRLFPNISNRMVENPRLVWAVASINDPFDVTILIISWISLGILQWFVLKKWVDRAYLWIVFILLLGLSKTFFTHLIHLCNVELLAAPISSFVLISLLRFTWLKSNNMSSANPRST